MKNATKHAPALRSLAAKLVKAHEPGRRPAPVEPRRALVAAVLAEDCPDALADAALDAFDAEFVDYNELRVATELEVQDLLGRGYPDAVARTARLHRVLHAVFQREAGFVMEQWAALGKKDQRQYLRELDAATPFVEAHVMLHATTAAAVPIDAAVLALLKDRGAVDTDADAGEATRLAEQTLAADECWPFYAACRAEAHAEAAAKVPARKKAG